MIHVSAIAAVPTLRIDLFARLTINGVTRDQIVATWMNELATPGLIILNTVLPSSTPASPIFFLRSTVTGALSSVTWSAGIVISA